MARAIENLENAFDEMFDFITDLPSGLDGFESDFDSAFEELRELKATLTPPNEPLTIKQLREMDGEPVYVVPANEYSELGKWCVISIGDSDDYSCALVPGVEYWSWKFEGYGEQWIAYRRPPEGEEDKNG
jgi:hypothetical protein